MTDRAEAQALLDGAIQAFERGEALRWGLQLLSETEVIGTVSLFHLDAQNRRGEIGYALASDHWGRGLMHEALCAVVDYAFGAGAGEGEGLTGPGLGLKRLEGRSRPAQRGLAALALERLGFQREGLLRERWTVAGETTDSLIMGLLRREWVGRS